MGRFAFQNPLPWSPPCSPPDMPVKTPDKVGCVAFEIYRMRRLMERRCRTSLMLSSGESGTGHAINKISNAKEQHLRASSDVSTDTLS